MVAMIFTMVYLVGEFLEIEKIAPQNPVKAFLQKILGGSND